MASRSWRPVQLSPWLGLPLSLWMIVIAGQTFTAAPFGDGPDWPVLTSFRDPRSLLNILNHRSQTTPAWLYKGAKGATAILWSILIPAQHSQYIRRWYPGFHRRSGYMVILLSIELAVAGYYMSSQGLVTTHPNWYHVHTFYSTKIPLPLLWWPTFNVSITILGLFYFLSLYKLYSSVRMKRLEAHRRWAVFHSMTGYAISIERFIAVIVLGFGWLLTTLPDTFQTQRLRLPKDIDGKLEVEVSALAWTLTAAGATVALWTYTMASSCKQLYELWTAHGAAVLWTIWKKEVPALEEALLSLRVAQFVHNCEARKEPLPHSIIVSEFDGRCKKPTLSELGNVWGQHLIAAKVCAQIERCCDFYPGDAYPSLEHPDHVEECTERIHKAIYRVLIAGAALAGVYNAPRYTSNPIDPSTALTAEQRQKLMECPAFNMVSSDSDDDDMFGPFATWLCDSILADSKARHDMAQRHERKTGRGLCCVRNQEIEDHLDRIDGEDEEINLRECHLLDSNGLSHSDTHLVTWQVMQMLHVHQRLNSTIKESPNVTPPPGDPSAYRKIPIVFFGEFCAREVCFTRITVHDRKVEHVVVRPAAYRIADKRRIHYSEAQGQDHWGTVLNWVNYSSGQPNTYIDTNQPTTPLGWKLFDYLLRRFARVRFPPDYFQEEWSQHWRDLMTFQASFNIFSSDEVPGRQPMQSEYVDGDFFDGSELLTRIGPELATYYS
ncbi:hypothetical protein PWT90_08682 [Aphanocladium album]|nr:hypothetical protein PWT90_08682 [Aphanocladium album]